MGQQPKVELLAPAGNKEGFYGAIHAGADAVYLGGSRFGARAYADNFTTEELISCIRYAHLWGRKVYLTVNTLVKEREFSDLYDYLLPYYEAGLDGVIVQDIGVLVFIRDHFPGMELHVSTQMTLTGIYGAALLKEMGACRIVPARELNLQEIIHIKEQTGLAIETFIHGAMCYCYSGQCLFSSVLGGRSGNRGRCAQPCRLPYKVETKKGSTKECYPLSLKDMCTIEHIPELIRAGIDSFKIEGRMKKPEYTAGVTAVYRKYIDLYYDRPSSDWKIEPKDLKELSCLYIRSERQDGYYYKHNGRDMVTLKSPAYSGSDEALLAGIRHTYLEQRPRVPVMVYGAFTEGNIACVTMISGDLSVTVEGEVVQRASRQPITRDNIAKQLGKLGDSIFTLDTVDSVGENDTVSGMETMCGMEITVSENAFYPLRAINELRREAIARLEDALIEKNGLPVRRDSAVESGSTMLSKGIAQPEAALMVQMRNKSLLKTMWSGIQLKTTRSEMRLKAISSETGRLFVSLRTKEQLRAVAAVISHIRIRRFYLDIDLFDGDTKEVLSLCRQLAGNQNTDSCKEASDCELVISWPYILREEDYSFVSTKAFSLLWEYQDLFSGFQVRSMESMGMIIASGYPGRVYGDAGFYIWNRETLWQWGPFLSGFCLPYELKGAEQKELLTDEIPCEKIVYGRIPMMVTANCVAKTAKGCCKGSGERTVQLIDRYQKKFPVELNCIHCMNIIYNSVPLSLHGELSKWEKLVDFRLDFTIESEQETIRVLQYFERQMEMGYCGSEKLPYGEYTTGHEKRGVE